MKKYILSISLFLFFLVGLAVDASAKDMSRRFGLGIDSTISSYGDDGKGVSAVYNINKYIGLQLIFGLNTTSAKLTQEEPGVGFSQGDKTTIVNWNVALRGLIPLVLASDVNLTLVVGFSASGRSSGGFKSDVAQYLQYNEGYQFAIDIGVRPEYFFSDHFSIHTQVGIGMNIITDGGTKVQTVLKNDKNGNGLVKETQKTSGVEVDFFKNVDLVGMAGCTFWF
ncbi:MAG: hypothetical protein IJU23_04880 [Proteobacteria bacterium]|nr:hypothetical protein [Pseudomonadota bacterium]